ncbi:hypothetical protein LSM04_003911 [Trypanosoma melophagium]|uniref:uncharacterized protein n=1 Tax=Trypanosoma melophagium TaxID=715481 RepID=UPI003519F709|nr:hypothetical protein LSM04_003911 [Trypanosoma melophagium]
MNRSIQVAERGKKKQEMDTNESIRSPQTTSLLLRFLHFLWACHTHVDLPLEHTLQRSIELAHFTESIQPLCVLPRQQLNVRWALWELLHNAVARERHVDEMEKQSRLYGGGWAKTITRRVSPWTSSVEHGGIGGSSSSSSNNNNTTIPTTLGTSSGNNTSHSTYYYHSYYHNPNKNGAGGMTVQFLREMSESEEEALLAALRARGHYHARLPRHANNCSRRIKKNSNNNNNNNNNSNSSLCNSSAVEPKNMDVVLGPVASLTSGCSLCIAEALLQGCWMCVRLVQLIDTVAAAHLCAAPLIIPTDVLSLTPREAMCVAYHTAQHQLQLSITLLLSIATEPQPSSTSLPASSSYLHVTGEDEKRHYARTATAIAAVAQQGLEVCVHLLSALRSLRGENMMYVVLLHAATLTFCDRDGVRKAKQLMMNFATSLLLLDAVPEGGGGSAKTSCAKKKLNDNDLYHMWLRIESLIELGDGVKAYEGRTLKSPSLLRIEEVTTGVLFTVYLELLQLRELPLPTTHQASGMDASISNTAAGEAAINVCLRAREVLDTIVQPRLLKLCDAVDGAVCTRGRQLQSLYWLLRGTLSHILNTLCISTTSPTRSEADRYKSEDPLECMREAVKGSEAAREFLAHPLAPDWVNIIMTQQQHHHPPHSNTTITTANDGKDNVEKGEKEHMRGIGWWRLQIEMHANDKHYCEKESTPENVTLSPLERVTDVALLPLSAMRLWFVLARTVFRSVSADLVSARVREDVNDPTTPVVNTAPHSVVGVPVVSTTTTTTTAVGPSSTLTTAAHENDKNIHTNNSNNNNNRSGGKKERRGAAAAAQRAAIEERTNRHKTEEAQRRTEQSPLGFWYRWHEAIHTNCLMSRLTKRGISLLGRFKQVMCFASGGNNTTVMTTFMRVLSEECPIAASQQEAFVAAQLIDPDLLSTEQKQQQEEEEIETKKEEEPSLALLDERLRHAWESYDLQCVQPAVALGETSDTGSNINNNKNNNHTKKNSNDSISNGSNNNKFSNRGVAKLQNVSAMPTKRNGERLHQSPQQKQQEKNQKQRGMMFNSPSFQSHQKVLARLSPLTTAPASSQSSSLLHSSPTCTLRMKPLSPLLPQSKQQPQLQ